MEKLKKKFGQRLRELRKAANLTQEQLAEKIGMDTQNLCKMENGNHFPQSKNLEKIADALNIEVQELFNFSHITDKDILINEIINYLNNAKNEEIVFLYKTIKNIQQYNNC